MNYFNYFTEIEDEYVRRRGSHVLITLIEAWRQLEIPLSIVLRGINAAFDSFDRLPQRGRKVNSLLYCQQEVEALYQQYRESQIGSNEPSVESSAEDSKESHFSPSKVIAFLDERLEILRERHMEYSITPGLGEALGRAIARLEDLIRDVKSSNAPADQGIERALLRIEELILDGIEQSLSEEERKLALKEAQKKLKVYREAMGAEVYEHTLRNYLAKDRRERFAVPRLSLFYM